MVNIKIRRGFKLFAGITTVLSFITGAIFMINHISTDQKYLEGNWDIEFVTTHANLERYIGMTLGYKMYITQTENEYQGVGETWSVDGKDLPFSRHRKLTMTGTIDGDKFNGTYILKGAKRETVGSFTAELSKNRLCFEGDFVGTAADSRGEFKGCKVE